MQSVFFFNYEKATFWMHVYKEIISILGSSHHFSKYDIKLTLQVRQLARAKEKEGPNSGLWKPYNL